MAAFCIKRSERRWLSDSHSESLACYRSPAVALCATWPTGGNHHIRELGIQYDPESSSVEVTFANNSPRDDNFRFDVFYFFAPTQSNVHFCRGPYSQEFRFIRDVHLRKISPGYSLLSGFHFRFEDDDHHFRRIAIDPMSRERFFVSFMEMMNVAILSLVESTTWLWNSLSGTASGNRNDSSVPR